MVAGCILVSSILLPMVGFELIRLSKYIDKEKYAENIYRDRYTKNETCQSILYWMQMLFFVAVIANATCLTFLPPYQKEEVYLNELVGVTILFWLVLILTIHITYRCSKEYRMAKKCRKIRKKLEKIGNLERNVTNEQEEILQEVKEELTMVQNYYTLILKEQEFPDLHISSKTYNNLLNGVTKNEKKISQLNKELKKKLKSLKLKL